MPLGNMMEIAGKPKSRAPVGWSIDRRRPGGPRILGATGAWMGGGYTKNGPPL